MMVKIKRFNIFASCILLFISCKDEVQNDPFPDGYEPKTAIIPAYNECKQPENPSTVNITVFTDSVLGNISKYVYGNNANVYMTQMVEQDTLIHHLSLLSPTILRYPGGNLSNLFFWNAEPGKLPDDVPDTLWGGVDNPYIEEYWYGKNNKPSTLNVDNYYKMLEMVGATGIITVNYAYTRYGLSDNPVTTAAHLAANWVRYDKGRTRYWEIGNENYGPWQAGYKIDSTKNKDGQPTFISGELYGTHFKVFIDSMRAAAKEVGNDIKIGAVVLEAANSWAKDPEKYWNEGFFKIAGNAADFFIIHSYFTPYKQDSDIPAILNSAAHETKRMKDFVIAECEKYNVDVKQLALTEWNIFAMGSKQSCSYISGIHSALVLGELITNNYWQASRWNLANGYADGNDHGMFSQGDEPGVPKWNPRPAYFYMYYFQKYFGDRLFAATIEGNDEIVAYVSSFSSGEYGIVIINKGPEYQVIKLAFDDNNKKGRYYYFSLTGGSDNGDYSQQVYVNGSVPTNITGGPVENLENIKAWSSTYDENFKVGSPAHSVQYIIITN